MNKEFFRTLTSALLFLIFMVFSGCRDEITTPENNDKVEEIDGMTVITLPAFFNLSIDQSELTTSRAVYDDGTEDEYEIAPGENHHFMIVYESNNDSEQTPLAVIPLTITKEDIILDPNKNETNNLTLTISKIISSRFLSTDFLDLDDVKSFLSNKDFFILLNFDHSLIPDSDKDIEKKSTTLGTLDGIKKGKFLQTLLNDYKITLSINKDNKEKEVDFFTMSNSVYAENDKISYGQKVDPSRVYQTEELAKAAAEKGEATIIIYVERLASKMTVEFPKDSPNILKKYTGYTPLALFTEINPENNYQYMTKEVEWTATIVGYGMNGLEPTEYIIKKIDAAAEYFEGWTTDHRSFWADDPNYTIANDLDKYPHQYRQALEKGDAIRGYHGGSYKDDGTLDGYSTVNTTYCLNYVSLKDIMDKKSTMYALENTYNDSNEDPAKCLGERGYFSAGTHLLVACRLEINDEDVPAGSDIWRDQNDYYYTDKYQMLQAKIDIIQNKILPGGNSGIRVYNTDWYNHKPLDVSDLITVSWDPGAKLQINDGGVLKELTVKDLTFIPAEITGGDGQLLIAPIDRDAEYYLGGKSLSVGNTPGSSYNRVVSLFYKEIGPIDHFSEGYMYYAVPVIQNVSTLVQAEWNRVGDYGTVRNHWYEFKVNGVTSPGTPVDQIEQPIIPMMDVKRNSLNVTVSVLDWHHLPEMFPPLYPNL